MTVNPVALKPGVHHVHTSTGGTLMDIQADRFIALSPVSSAVWCGLEAGHKRRDLIDTIRQVKGVCIQHAEAVLSHQFDRWEKAGLINLRQRPALLPHPKKAPITSPEEPCISTILGEPLVLSLLARLFAAELQYRRAVMKCGLARTLVRLQKESGTLIRPPESTVLRTIRNYHALRRAFRQGRTAHDCLFRSLALAAVLQRQGIQADLCIGIIDLPFSSHAWVEAAGLVLNETLSKRSEYTIIGRF